MSHSFFITPREYIDPDYAGPDVKFYLKLDEFANALKAQWEHASVSIDNSEHFALNWECMINNQYGLMGSLFRDFCGVVLERPTLEDVADFAIWFRSIIPSDVRLAVYNSSDITPFDLTIHTTYLQVIDFFTHYDYLPMLVFAVPNNQTFDLNQLEICLKHKWPEVEIFSTCDDDPYAFYWEVNLLVTFKHQTQLSDGKVSVQEAEHWIIQSGAVNPQRTAIYFSYYPYCELAKVLLWFRSILPESDELFVERKVDERRLILAATTTAEEIIETFTRDWERGQS